MIQKISAPISVRTDYDCRMGKFFPTGITWEGRDYPVTQIGFHHTYRKGRVLYHVFSVSAKTLFFRIELNSEDLTWRLEEIADDF